MLVEDGFVDRALHLTMLPVVLIDPNAGIIEVSFAFQYNRIQVVLEPCPERLSRGWREFDFSVSVPRPSFSFKDFNVYDCAMLAETSINIPGGSRRVEISQLNCKRWELHPRIVRLENRGRKRWSNGRSVGLLLRLSS